MQIILKQGSNRIAGYALVGQLEGGVEYEGEIPPDFDKNSGFYSLENGCSLVFHSEWKSEAEQTAADEAEMAELEEWFSWYDVQVAQYSRCLRLGMEFDGSIALLDSQASTNQLRLRELKGVS